MNNSGIHIKSPVHGIGLVTNLLFSLLFLFQINLYAQNTFPNRSGNFPNTGDQLGQDSIEQEVLEDIAPDTIRIYSPFQLKKARYFNDTILDNQFHQYEAIRLQQGPYLHLGNNGSPNRNGMFQLYQRQGLDIGSHVLDIYRLRYEDIGLLDSKRPITKFRFVQKSLSQLDLQLESTLSKTFQNGLHLNILYKVLNYAGDFREQINKNNSGSFNIWYHSPKGNYDFIINYLANNFKLQDNGGLSDIDSLFKIGLNRKQPSTIITNAIDARSHQKDNAISIQNGFTVNLKGSKLVFTHLLSTSNQTYSYTDRTEPTDSVYYRGFYSTDTVAVFLNSRGLLNDFRLEGKIKENTYLMAGLRHEIHTIKQTANKYNLNLLFLNGLYQQSIGGIQLDASGQWGLLENFGEYFINGKLAFDGKKLGSVEGHITLQRSPVPLLFKQLYNRTNLVYTNTFEKPLTNQIGGSLFIPVLSFKAGVDQSILSNTIYLDSLRLPAQEKSTIGITTLFADKTFKFGKFHSRHRLALQLSTENEILRAAPWFTQNLLFYQDSWFKDNMQLQVGFDSRIYPGFKTNSYFPLLGNFYNNAGASPLDLHPSLEAFFNFQLKNFRGFAKMEGLEYMIYPTGRVFYETYGQPLFRTNFRLGLTWIMRD